MNDHSLTGEDEGTVDKPPRKVYLAGSIHHSGDDGKTWREIIMDEWGDFEPIEWVSPIHEFDYDADKHSEEDLVNRDKKLLGSCDVMLVGFTGKRTPGTWREVEYAISVLEIPVFVWTAPAPLEVVAQKDPFSPWAEEAGLMGAYLDELIEVIVDSETIDEVWDLGDTDD